VTYADAIQFLCSLQVFGANFGLDNTRRLAALAGNPQERLRFIHVAGTNGKGSTCAMLESVYRDAGLRVGLFTSPHLVSFRERIQVDRRHISEADVARFVEEMQPSLVEFPRGQHPTFFEVVTVIALRHFAEQRCDLVIWETGLGGRLDATNIVTPLASVITNIGFDHQQWLGNTLTAIATEKAGIIKAGMPVITATEDAEALEVIRARATELNAPLEIVNAKTGESALPATIVLPLAGGHQRMNAALALATVDALQGVIPVSLECVRRGLETVHWPGRLQFVTTSSGQQILLDGAHNVPGCDALARSIQELLPGRKPALLLGMLSDKDCGAMCDRLAPLAKRIGVVAVASERTALPQELATHCRRANPTARVECFDSVSDALSRLSSESLVLVGGSLYLAGEVMALLGLSGTTADERELNEWK